MTPKKQINRKVPTKKNKQVSGQNGPNKPGPWKPKTPPEVPVEPEKEPWNPAKQPQKPETPEPGKPETEPGPEPHQPKISPGKSDKTDPLNQPASNLQHGSPPEDNPDSPLHPDQREIIW